MNNQSMSDNNTINNIDNSIMQSNNSLFNDMVIPVDTTNVPAYDPMSGIARDHDMHVNDTLWFYGGRNDNNWLYNKPHCIKLTQAYNLYMDGHTNNSTTQIQVFQNNNNKIYIIDFEKMVQYPIDDRKRKRNIGMFKLQGIEDFESNQIVGISGMRIQL